MISEKESKYLKVALLVAGLMLCAALVPGLWSYDHRSEHGFGLPFGYYIFLRLVVCAAALYAAVLLREHEALHFHFIPLVALALLFNPVITIVLPRGLWMFIDLGTAAYFLALSKKTF